MPGPGCWPTSTPGGQATPFAVSVLEEAVSNREWWADQWPEGAVFVAGLVAQDVQDALLESVGRWPLCLTCEEAPPHALYIQPDLGGPDPVWVCEETGRGRRRRWAACDVPSAGGVSRPGRAAPTG